MSGAIKPEVPHRPRLVCLLPTNQPTPFFPPRATEDFTKEKREREIALEKAWIKDWRPVDLDFTSLSLLSSQGTLITDLVRSTWSMHDFKIPSMIVLHWWWRSNAQSLVVIRVGLNQGTLVRVADGPYRTCSVCYRTCPVLPSRAGSLLPLIQCYPRIAY